MSYRLAQEHADLIASIASLAGGRDHVSSLPPPNNPVSVLEIHGTQDTFIPYTGGNPNGIPGLPSNPVPVTGARESVQRWADWNGCAALQDDPAPSLDFDSSLAGPDTVVTKTTNCASGVTAELWTINNGSHFPAFTPNFARELVSWLPNHPNPYFGDNTSLTFDSDLLLGVTRSFSSFSAALDEIKDARIFAGIHFRTPPWPDWSIPELIVELSQIKMPRCDCSKP